MYISSAIRAPSLKNEDGNIRVRRDVFESEQMFDNFGRFPMKNAIQRYSPSIAVAMRAGDTDDQVPQV